MHLTKSLRRIFRIIIFLIFGLVILKQAVQLYSPGNGKLITETADNPELLQLNPLHPYLAEMPVPAYFKKHKDDSTIRIFVLGPPVNPDLPENPNSSFTHMLNGYLQYAFPGKNIELINIACKKAPSEIQRSIARQLTKFSPDVVMLCPGRDEPSAGKQAERRIARFESNLDETVKLLQKKGIAVVLLNSSANLDIPPQKCKFTSPNAGNLNTLFENGRIAYENEDYQKAYSHFIEIFRKESTHAPTLYYLGKIALKQGDPAQARRLLIQARDNDTVCKLPLSEINRIILKAAVTRECKLVDMERIFSRFSQHGIPGNNLFHGGQQVNLAGNLLIARECYKTLIKAAILSHSINNIPAEEPNIIPFDSAYDRYCASYPGKGESENSVLGFDLQPATTFEQITVSLFAGRERGWEETMNNLYEFYLSGKNYKMAFRVIENLALENPYNISINKKAYQTAAMMGDSQMVVHYASKVYAVQRDIDTSKQLFISYLKLDKPENALPYLEYARRNTTESNLNLIYTAVTQIIELKKTLQHDPGNLEVKQKIAEHYYAIGNDEVARGYAA